MARQARERDLYGLYHISQTSQRDRVIFRSDLDRQAMLDILHRAEAKYNFKLAAYCLIDRYVYHLLLKMEGCDISQLMKSINISYIKRLKLPSGLFRDRYESTLLTSPQEGRAMLRKLQERAEGHKRWNSYCTVDRAMQAAGIRAQDVYVESSTQSPAEAETRPWPDCCTDVAEVRQYLERLAADRQLTLDELMARPRERNQLIREMRRHSTLSQAEIGRLFNLSASSISKILQKDQL